MASMPRWNEGRFSRVFGDVAVLSRLEHLGKNPRQFEHLVTVGFPEHQLREARDWYYKDATTAVERYAADRMAQGFFEDESLLDLFCRYYECTDWKLVGSPWFFSKQEYHRLFKVLTDPVEFHIAQLEQGLGEERWGASFMKLPYDLGMENAKRSLWQEICQRDHFWKPLASYSHLRAEQLFQYLKRTVNIVDFSVHQFNYNWEQAFRKQFHPALEIFGEALERCVRGWQDKRKEKTTRRFHYESYRTARRKSDDNLQAALAYMNLDPEAVSLKSLARAFRRLSKNTHPDHGGTPEEFRKLSAYKAVVESWLMRSQAT
ncbi:MAG: hypothetical protein O7A08_13715 [SAR324 cluster bacterium]|nr:hypothetical protein [SAR324 cluster bacterium]MCZ6556720.1 hypothetical protein [SAR324 cluster bacterium]